MSENEQAANETVALLFYRQIAALHPLRHGELKVGVAADQSFAANTNSVPLAAVEFVESCKEYPIVFVRADNGDFNPVAILGLENNENLFLDASSRWKAAYVPAFVRRYPFVLGNNPQNEDQPLVCVDEACPWLGKEAGEPLFVGDQPSTFLRQTLTFLNDFNVQSQRTQAFSRKLSEWNLLVENQAQATTPDGKAYSLTGLWIVNESALAELEADKLQELFKTGELAWIYFHLASLSNLKQLGERKTSAAAPAQSPLH